MTKNSSYEDVNLILDRDEAIVNFFLEGQCIGPQGAFQLSVTFPTKFVRVLELRNNNIGVTGAPHLAKAIARHPSLVYVGLARNHLSSHGACEVINVLKYPECMISGLDLQWNDIADSSAKMLGDVLKVNKTLQSINMDRNRIRTEGAEAIADGLKVNKTLQNLSLGWNRVRVGVEALGAALEINTTLHTLNLCDNEIIAENAIIFAQRMSANKSLHSLDISNNNIGEAATVFLKALAAGSLHLREFHINNCKLSNCEALSMVYPGNSKLFFLNIAGNPLKDTFISKYLDSCQNACALRVLDLSGCNMTHQSLTCLTEITTTCPYLHTLNLEGNDLGVTGSTLVGHAMGARTGAVTSLNISRTWMTAAGARALAQGLAQQRRIIHLYVADNDLGTDGVSEICSSLLGYGSLQTLDLCQNRAGSVVTMYLRKVILAHAELSYISVIGNGCAVDLQGGVYSRVHAETLDFTTSRNEEEAVEESLPPPHVVPMSTEELPTKVGEVNQSPNANGTSHNQPYGRKWNNFNRSTAVKEILSPNNAMQERNAALFFSTPVSTEREASSLWEPGRQSLTAYSSTQRSKLIELFSRLDTNGSGYLDTQELRKLVENAESYGVQYTQRNIDDMLTKYGIHKDNRVTFEKFEVIMLQLAKR